MSGAVHDNEAVVRPTRWIMRDMRYIDSVALERGFYKSGKIVVSKTRDVGRAAPQRTDRGNRSAGRPAALA
jgi:hypothetical protein